MRIEFYTGKYEQGDIVISIVVTVKRYSCGAKLVTSLALVLADYMFGGLDQVIAFGRFRVAYI